MNDFDEVLKALGGGEAPAGLEERVLRRLARQPARRTTAGWLRVWALSGTLAMTALALVAAVMLQHRTAPAKEPRVEAAKPVREDRQQRVIDAPRLASTAPLSRQVVARTGSARAGWDTRPEVLATPETTATKLSAQTQEPGYPAPPMPLTDQEKVLLQIARDKDLPKFAAFNPENRDELIAQSKAEFDEYFPKPNSQEIYYESHRQNP